RIYLGAAPGVGKTYAMLGEGHRRKQRGADVVVGLVETHGREQTQAQIGDLDVVERTAVEYRGTTLYEMNVDAIVARHPDIVLVDEYAHTNAPGSRNTKRWQDVEALLDAGIDVISTLNIQHLESLNDVITEITGTVQRETVPDAVVRRADQLELVDMSPEALRRRMAHGNVYPPERIDAAMSNYFRPGNLGALRELALLWVADRVEESLATYRSSHGITDTWETRERIVVGITGRRGGDMLIRRAARMAGRIGGDLVGVHVTADDGLSIDDAELLSVQRRLVEQLGGRVHDVVAPSPADGLVSFAHAEKATQLVLGSSRRSRLHELLHGSFAGRVIRAADGIDVHVIADEDRSDPQRRGRRPPDDGSGRRRRLAWLLTVIGLPLLIAATVPFRSSIALTTELLLFLTVVLIIAAIGGRIVAAAAAVVASLLVNWFYVVPYHTLTIAEPEHIVSLVVFVGVAIAVGSLVDTAARRAYEAQRARIEATALARSAATMAADPEALPRLIEQIRSTFGLDRVRLIPDDELSPGYDTSTGALADRPVSTVPVGDPMGTDGGHRLELYGRPLSGDDQRVLRALADQLAVAIERSQLGREAAEAEALANIDAMRTALLRAVSHDLRTPLASIKAMVSGLLESDVTWRPEHVRDALETVDEEADRLNRLVGNLLDASRLQIGALAVNCQPVDMAESIAATLSSIGPAADRVDVHVPDGLPPAYGDAALLERSLHNVVTNALHHAGDSEVRLTVGVVGNEMHVCTIDRGPGIPKDLRTKVMAPFQQLGDDRSADGVGLGMSIAQGFVQAMHGRLELDDTPGGGLTVIIAIPLVEPAGQGPS
ncbi:MAG: two-component system, OmpR family, sensor histidine kinase KdpD, partial [Ilumatobacteraceae bacterium]